MNLKHLQHFAMTPALADVIEMGNAEADAFDLSHGDANWDLIRIDKTTP